MMRLFFRRDFCRDFYSAALIFLITSVSSVSVARPQYMLKHGLVSCTSCHISPAGGGIRNVNGKMYGAHGNPTSAHHLTDLYQMDFRALAYYPEKTQASRDGVGLMALFGSGNVPVFEDENVKTNFVASYSFGGFATGIRDAYIRTEFKKGWIEHIVLGLFNEPFGLLTDEHRTFTRTQSKTTFNDYSMGAMVSGRITERSHFDLAVAQGFQNSASEGAGNFSTGPTSNVVGNLRWMPARVPVMLGASAKANQRHSGETDPYAYTLYSGLSLDRLTGGRFPSQILFEISDARYWNDSTINPDFSREFVTATDAAYAAALQKTISRGMTVYWHYDWSPRLILTYKYEHFLPARNYTGDYYDRHGVGFRYNSSANLQWWLRLEKAEVGRPDLNPMASAAKDSVWALAHYWF